MLDANEVVVSMEKNGGLNWKRMLKDITSKEMNDLMLSMMDNYFLSCKNHYNTVSVVEPPARISSTPSPWIVMYHDKSIIRSGEVSAKG